MADSKGTVEGGTITANAAGTGTDSGSGGAAGAATTRSGQLHHHVVPTERCGALNVYVQGDIEEAHKDKDSKSVFLTVHDIGTNHKSFERLFNNEAFDEIRKRAIFVFVDLPGQENNAPNSESFPKIQAIGEDLITILDQLRIKYCIGIGDGAGSNIIARFGMMHVTRCLGVILIHPTANASTMMEAFKDKFAKLKIRHSGENIIAFRKFGHKFRDGNVSEKDLEEINKAMMRQINPHNLKLFMDTFMNRSDITSTLKTNLKCDALIVVGGRSSHVHAAEFMHSNMDKTRSSLLKVDNVGNVMEEAPQKLAQSILLFCKGLGWLTSVDLPGVGRRTSGPGKEKTQRQRSVSMEDYDKPNLRRLSVSSKE